MGIAELVMELLIRQGGSFEYVYDSESDQTIRRFRPKDGQNLQGVLSDSPEIRRVSENLNRDDEQEDFGTGFATAGIFFS